MFSSESDSYVNISLLSLFSEYPINSKKSFISGITKIRSFMALFVVLKFLFSLSEGFFIIFSNNINKIY